METHLKVRAYVAVSRNRSKLQTFETVRGSLANLAEQQEGLSEYVFRAPLVLWGGIDVLVPVDAVSTYELHNAVTEIAIASGGGETNTFVAASESIENSKTVDEAWKDSEMGLIAINLRPESNTGQKTDDRILSDLRKRSEIMNADIVFGKYDIVAIFRLESESTPRTLVENIVATHPEISKTSTFLPYKKTYGQKNA